MSSACGYQCKALPGVEMASWPSCAPSYADLRKQEQCFRSVPCETMQTFEAMWEGMQVTLDEWATTIKLPLNLPGPCT